MPKRSLWVEGRDDGAGIVAGEVRRGRTELEAGALEEAARRREARREVVGLDPVALRDPDAGVHRGARGTPIDEGPEEPAAEAEGWPTGALPASVCAGDKRVSVTLRPLLPDEQP